MSLTGGDPRAFDAAWKAAEQREKRKREQEAIDRRLAELGERLRELREKGEKTFGKRRSDAQPADEPE